MWYSARVERTNRRARGGGDYISIPSRDGKGTTGEADEDMMDNRPNQDGTGRPSDMGTDMNPNAAVPIDEVIYSREQQGDLPEDADADGVGAKTPETDPREQDNEAPTEGFDEPIPMPSAQERSFMEEMGRGDWEDDDEYVDMPTYDEVVAENAKLNRQLASVISQYEALKKDWESYRQRSKDEVERSKKLASERVATQIIPVVDDIWRSVAHMRGMGEAFVPLANGNAAIAKRIVAALAKEGVEVISPLGEPFDMNRHQAIAMEEAEGYEPNTVFRVYQYGYAIGDRIVRPAMVGVAK